MFFNKPLSDIPGIGKKKSAALSKLGLVCFNDVLNHYPRAYQDRSIILSISSLVNDEYACFKAKIIENISIKKISHKLTITKTMATDDMGVVSIVFYNNKFAHRNLKYGSEYYFYGRVIDTRGILTLENPDFEPAQRPVLMNKIVPVYPLTSGISLREYISVSKFVLDSCLDSIQDSLPDEIIREYNLVDRKTAFLDIHFPQNMDDIEKARYRIMFEQYLIFFCAVRKRRLLAGDTSFVYTNLNIQPFLESLHFTLTSAQISCLNDCIQDLMKGKRLIRLIQGDVGSGKTVVSATISYMSFINGFQTAIMAPTEILAIQHFDYYNSVFSAFGAECILLTGSLSRSKRLAALEKIRLGEAKIIIGTHSLIQKDVIYNNLSLIIADEQHRFGVQQREELARKGSSPHIVLMSATPIPRTLAITLHGDMDISIINELPANRKPVRTFVVSENIRNRVNNFIEKSVLQGFQVYIVCPLVEHISDYKLELMAAIDYVEKLRLHFKNFSIGLIHGKLKSAEKHSIMQDFLSNKIQILVATTVIEVGVNNPNATLIIVENADNFGLSQLHQLRGRVGRGDAQAYCIFFTTRQGSKNLSIMASTNDGFVIAEEDLKLRGPGDFFGNRQHGIPRIQLCDGERGLELLYSVKLAAEQIINDGIEKYEFINTSVNTLIKRELL